MSAFKTCSHKVRNLGMLGICFITLKKGGGHMDKQANNPVPRVSRRTLSLTSDRVVRLAEQADSPTVLQRLYSRVTLARHMTARGAMCVHHCVLRSWVLWLTQIERTHVDVRLEDTGRGRHERTVTSATSFSDDTQTAVRAVFVRCHLVLYVFLQRFRFDS